MKKLLIFTLLLALAIPSSAYASSSLSYEQKSTKEKIKFEEIVKLIDGDMRDQLIKDHESAKKFQEKVIAEKALASDSYAPLNAYEPINSYTYYEDTSNFGDVTVYNYTDANFGLIQTTWNFIGSGRTEKNFDEGMVTHSFTVYGVSTTWPPVTQTYSTSSNWREDHNYVAVTSLEEEKSFGHWIAGFSSVQFQVEHNGIYFTYNW